jgi:hypothetical protein
MALTQTTIPKTIPKGYPSASNPKYIVGKYNEVWLSYV